MAIILAEAARIVRPGGLISYGSRSSTQSLEL
ncbi:MAG: hypothetical protein PUP91_05790 [Rhizonema sp. PD37]|nr:hypothetical protein [Rhizonema sp. PD37]